MARQKESKNGQRGLFRAAIAVHSAGSLALCVFLLDVPNHGERYVNRILRKMVVA
jgi:hypothetical protein